jgi:hypothetical protein
MSKPNKVSFWLLRFIFWLLYPFFKTNELVLSYRKMIYSVLLIFTLFLFLVKKESGRWTWADWTGFGKDSTVSKEEIFQGGKITTTKNITHFQSGKTLWDWLGLAGVIAIPIFLFQFQIKQQKIADNNQREDALRDYIDKIAELLIDKNLKVLLKKLYEGTITKDDAELDAVLDVARARTLSILRRLDGDSVRKASVVWFLIDAELIQNLDLLKNADLSRASLYTVNLEGANLKEANLQGAYLEGANLQGANLEGASLEGANLEGAKLNQANLNRANLEEAYLEKVNLEGANLKNVYFLTTEKVKTAKNWDKAKYDTKFFKKLIS